MGNVQSHAHIEQPGLVFKRFSALLEGSREPKCPAWRAFRQDLAAALISAAFYFTPISIFAIVASCMFEVPS
jgi:hypothetical protein